MCSNEHLCSKCVFSFNVGLLPLKLLQITRFPQRRSDGINPKQALLVGTNDSVDNLGQNDIIVALTNPSGYLCRKTRLCNVPHTNLMYFFRIDSIHSCKLRHILINRLEKYIRSIHSSNYKLN